MPNPALSRKRLLELKAGDLPSPEETRLLLLMAEDRDCWLSNAQALQRECNRLDAIVRGRSVWRRLWQRIFSV